MGTYDGLKEELAGFSVEQLRRDLERAERASADRLVALETAEAEYQKAEAHRKFLAGLLELRDDALVSNGNGAPDHVVLRLPAVRAVKTMAPKRRWIKELIEAQRPEKEWSPTAVWKALRAEHPDFELDDVQMTMSRMARASQLVRASRGLYQLPAAERRRR